MKQKIRKNQFWHFVKGFINFSIILIFFIILAYEKDVFIQVQNSYKMRKTLAENFFDVPVEQMPLRFRSATEVVNLILGYEKKLKELSFPKDYKGYKLLSNKNHLQPWIKVKAHRTNSLPCQSPGVQEELCWVGRWSDYKFED